MRLINCETLLLEDFIGDKIPDYAILSHTWGSDEVSFAAFESDKESARRKAGFKKIAYTCQQAIVDGLEWAWVDTICIDKTSSSELSEAINSMYKWYQDARICYAYLVDVTIDSWAKDCWSSRWFTRGWTLQELIASNEVIFYDAAWKTLGNKIQHAPLLARITQIDGSVFAQTSDYWLGDYSAAHKMSWTSRRQTTRIEDIAYSLLGLFDVNMPLLYGEGYKAFPRLQEEIIKVVDDDSIFAWGLSTDIKESQLFDSIANGGTLCIVGSMLATRPELFSTCHNVIFAKPISAYTMTNMGLELELPLIDGLWQSEDPMDGEVYTIGLLSCTTSSSDTILGILLKPVTGSNVLMHRVAFDDPNRDDETLIATFPVGPRLACKAIVRRITVVNGTGMTNHLEMPVRHRKFLVNPCAELAGFQYNIAKAMHFSFSTSEVHPEHVTWDQRSGVVTVRQNDYVRSLVEIILQSDCDDTQQFPCSIFIQGEQVVMYHGPSPPMQVKRRIFLVMCDRWRTNIGSMQYVGFSDDDGRHWVLIAHSGRAKKVHHWDIVNIDLHVLDMTGVPEGEVAAKCDEKMLELDNRSEQQDVSK